ncbi:DUF4271 domain-containing protein [Wenyingzhuangia sp. IMCC45574]
MLLLPLVFLFVMSRIDLKRTKLLLMVFFSNKYYYRYPVDTTATVSLYTVLLYGVNISVLNLLLVPILYQREFIFNHFFTTYFKSLLVAFLYLLIKYLIAEFVFFFLGRKDGYKQTFVMETSYLTSVLLISFFPISYAFLHIKELGTVLNIVAFFFITCYVVRGILMLANNKNLLEGKLYYIILYLCSLELVPIVYLFKRYLV